MPEISILIPVFNSAPWLDACLDSVLGQSVKDLEVVCIDDGSTDGSGAILDARAAADRRVRVIHAANRGQGAARNAAFDACSGNYVHFLDSDDMLLPGALETLLEKARGDNLDILFFGSETAFDSAALKERCPKEERGHPRSDAFSAPRTGPALLLDMAAAGEYDVPVWLYILRRDYVAERGIRFREDIKQEDLLFTFLSLVNAKRAAAVGKTCHRYRIREDSDYASSPPKFRNVASCAVVAREILRFGWNQPPEHDEERRAAAIAAKMAVGAVRYLWGRVDDAERRRAADLPPLDSFWLNTMLKTRSEREFAKIAEEKNAREREVGLLRKSLSFRLGSLLVAPAGLALAAIRRLSSHRR